LSLPGAKFIAKLPKKSKEDLKNVEYDFELKSEEVKAWELRGSPRVMPHLMAGLPDAEVIMMSPGQMASPDVLYYQHWAVKIREHEAERLRRQAVRAHQNHQAIIARIQTQARERVGVAEFERAQYLEAEQARIAQINAQRLVMMQEARNKSISRVGMDEDAAQARNKQRVNAASSHGQRYYTTQSYQPGGSAGSSRYNSGKPSLKSKASSEAPHGGRGDNIGRAR
jgi:hypothetical protein